uniref:Uncharacterized protein n=2 Tax=Avena sativa TaxID=4498 RepID=A0ACD5UJ59_AVESA
MATGSETQESNTSPELPTELPYDFLKTITDNFADERKISASPFGTVYKGVVPDADRVIAVKKLHEDAPIPAGKTFSKEVHHVLPLRHENIVQLVGFCNEATKKLVQMEGRYIQADIAECLLCYEYLPNGSLDHYLFGSKASDQDSSSGKPAGISWDTRFTIIEGICQGILFLHDLDIPIIHMDLKPENIWLGESIMPKIGNFELSVSLDREQTKIHTQDVVGSYGYMAPEYLHGGEISAKSDIYSLGLLIMEITTGEKNSPKNEQPSARGYIDKICEEWTLEHISSIYSSLDLDGLHQVKTCLELSLECVETDPAKRPSIDNIVNKLNKRRAS